MKMGRRDARGLRIQRSDVELEAVESTVIIFDGVLTASYHVDKISTIDD